MSVKVPIRTVFDGSTATGLAEYQSGEFIGLTHGGTGASLSIGSAGQVLKVNSGGSALEFGNVEAILNIDGMTDGSGITIVDGDDFAISDGGTEKKVNASQIATYVGANLSSVTITSLDIDGGTDIGAGLADADLFIVDDGAGGTNRKTAASRIKTYVADVTLTTAAQTNITSLGTLTALTVDNIAINGTNIGHTSDTDAIAIASDGKTTFSQQTIHSGGIVIADAGNIGSASDTDAIAIASDGVVTMNQIPVFSAGINVSGGTIAGTLATAAQTNITSLGTLTALTVDNIAINGTNIGHTSDADAIAIASDGKVTFTQQIIGTSLDISGDVDIDGTLEADAITVDGTTLAEFISDTTGAMFSSNTETGITVTYQDGDNTIDLALAAAQTTITSLLATDIKIGEDDQTKIDFETADEIHFYAANAEQVFVSDGVFGPQTDSDVDLGTNSVRFKDAYIDTITTTGVITSGSNLVIANNGNIGSAGDTDAIAIDSSGNVTASQNLVVTGNFTVNGTTTTVNTTNMKVSDTLIELNTGAGSNANDMGLIMERGSTGDNAIFMFDESADEFTVGTTTATNDATGNISVTAGTFTAATLKGNLVVADDGDIGSASATDAMQISSGGIVTFKDDIIIKDGGTIGAASAATAMTISSAGIVTFVDDILIKDGGTIGVASAATAITIASSGIVTLVDDLLIKDGGTIGNASVADVMTLASTGIVTFKDDILIKDGGTIGSASDADAITIASDGVTTFSQKDVHSVGLSVKNGSSSAGFVEFFENSGNGTNKVTLIGPASTSDVTLTLGSTTGTVATTDDIAGEATALAIALG